MYDNINRVAALRQFLCTVLGLLVVVLAGCGDGRPERVKVSGKVLIDGKPIRHGIVQVLPKGQRAATGRIGEDGSFTLSCYEPEDGCIPGTHEVIVDGRKSINLLKTEWHAPKTFAQPGVAGLTITVDEPTDDLVLDFKSPGGNRFEPFVETARGGPSEAAMIKADQPF